MTKHKIQTIKSTIASTWKEDRFRRSLLTFLREKAQSLRWKEVKFDIC